MKWLVQPAYCITATAACRQPPISKTQASVAVTRSCPNEATQPRQAHAASDSTTNAQAAISLMPR